MGVVCVLREELEEGFGEWGRGVVIGFDDGGDFVCRARGGVVSVWLGVLVCVGLGHAVSVSLVSVTRCGDDSIRDLHRAPLLHWTDFVLWEGQLLFSAIEFRIKGDLGAGQGTMAVAPFLGVFFLPLEWERI